MLLAVRHWRWWEYWVDSQSKYKVINFEITYLSAFSTIAGMSLARYGLDSSKQGFVFTSIM